MKQKEYIVTKIPPLEKVIDQFIQELNESKEQPTSIVETSVEVKEPEKKTKSKQAITKPKLPQNFHINTPLILKSIAGVGALGLVGVTISNNLNKEEAKPEPKIQKIANSPKEPIKQPELINENAITEKPYLELKFDQSTPLGTLAILYKAMIEKNASQIYDLYAPGYTGKKEYSRTDYIDTIKEGTKNYTAKETDKVTMYVLPDDTNPNIVKVFFKQIPKDKHKTIPIEYTLQEINGKFYILKAGKWGNPRTKINISNSGESNV